VVPVRSVVDLVGDDVIIEGVKVSNIMSCHRRYLGGERIHADSDEGSYILDHNNLSVEVDDHGSIPGGGVVVVGGYGVVGLGLGHLLGSEQLALEVPCDFLLLL
jgi:hypothetical protein